MVQRYRSTNDRRRANRRGTRCYQNENEKQKPKKQARLPFENVIRPTHLLRNPLEVKVARSPKVTSLDGKGKAA